MLSDRAETPVADNDTTLRDCWTTFYLAERRRLGAYARALTGDADRAADVVQDVITGLIARGAPPDSRALVLRAIRNRAIDQSRRFAARRARERATCVPDFVEADEPGAQAELAEQIQAALESLPAPRREVVVLRVYVGLGFQEIADVLERPLGSVTSDYRRALDELREILQPEHRNAS